MLGKNKYEYFFINEFIPSIEKNYRIRNQKEFRAIAGYSMGGWGALLYAIRYPQLFTAVGSVNGAIYTDEQLAVGLSQDKWDEVFGGIYGAGLKGMKRINATYQANAPLHLINKTDIQVLKSLRYYVDCSDNDYLLPGNLEFFKKMKSLKVSAEFRIRDGEHTWEYCRKSIPELLRFFESGFLQD